MQTKTYYTVSSQTHSQEKFCKLRPSVVAKVSGKDPKKGTFFTYFSSTESKEKLKKTQLQSWESIT